MLNRASGEPAAYDEPSLSMTTKKTSIATKALVSHERSSDTPLLVQCFARQADEKIRCVRQLKIKQNAMAALFTPGCQELSHNFGNWYHVTMRYPDHITMSCGPGDVTA
jgi:hypothetical protein